MANQIIDKALNLIGTRMSKNVLNASGTATVNAGQYYNLASVTLQPNTEYLILGVTSHGVPSEIATLSQISYTGSGYTSLDGLGSLTGSNGQWCPCWSYCKTGSTSVTAIVRTYGYYTTSHTATGRIIAVPLCLVGGVKRKVSSFFSRRVALPERGCA